MQQPVAGSELVQPGAATGLSRTKHQLPSQAVSETAAGDPSPSQPELEQQHHSQASPRDGVSPGCMTSLHQTSQEVSHSCVTGLSQHNHDMSHSCVTSCLTQPAWMKELGVQQPVAGSEFLQP